MKSKTFSWLFLAALILGLVTRGWQLEERFLYAHDGDLASWIVKDIVVDHHLRLIGQETSSPGIFIGPLFYYLLIPFYLFTGMDPVGGLAFPLFVGMAAIFSVYIVTKKLFSSSAANFAVLIYAVSFTISQTEREMVPTTPVMLWSVWFLYFIHRLFQGQKSALIWLAVLFALVWNINLALFLTFPLVLIAGLLNRRHFTLRDFVRPLLVLFFLSSPLWLFEIKHHFIQTRALFSTMVSSGSIKSDLADKIVHVGDYVSKNINTIFWDNPHSVSVYILPLLLIAAFIYLLAKKRLPGFYLFIVPVWLILNIIFFALQSLNLSEYYLNSLNILWVIITALLLDCLWQYRILKFLSLGLITLIIYYNLYLFFTSNINRFGYLEKKALTAQIAADAKLHGYPCVSVSYITNPGYNLGYRYFFYLVHLHVNQPKSGSPVYTIVFPHSLVNHLDKTYGALGLILPDYQRYSAQTVKISCQGPDANLTDPLFGFTR